MKTLGLRLMFVFLCIGILLYLGIKINIISSLFGKQN